MDDAYVEHERAAAWLRVLLDAQGRSVGTARAYAGRLSLYLSWAAAAGVEPSAPQADQLARFARWLERTPSRKHRPGRQRRRAADPKVVALGPARSAAMVEGILAAVVEFVRFGASRGWCEPAVAERLSFRTELAFAPRSWDRGERSERPVVERRVVRRRRVQTPPETLSAQQVGALVDACSNSRDRFVVEMLYATGLRVAEVCGLRLADLHLVPSAAHLGCRVEGAHLHVVRREDNDNGALAKSAWPRVVAVTKELVACHDAYRFERDGVPPAAESDYLLVNLWRAPVGRTLTVDAVERLFVRLSARTGFRARPHMLRHSFASEVAMATKDPALVKELLGHASVSSTDVYLHARWADMRAAVDGQARSSGQGR
ncbi:tyrosine-type recombinase/integrase [Acidimicrobiaceae bacterium USS-CC1]|uniref:Tyrosine-type recombinase/integrase n=1 Tax=Acidiferrimicrobium australe TaxID=2664430 RepID=A0ABW9QTQ5_9ACTN|nr:tyrosine-type recombinase/integrase [Acidiferrimicrobium australe]